MVVFRIIFYQLLWILASYVTQSCFIYVLYIPYFLLRWIIDLFHYVGLQISSREEIFMFFK